MFLQVEQKGKGVEGRKEAEKKVRRKREIEGNQKGACRALPGYKISPYVSFSYLKKGFSLLGFLRPKEQELKQLMIIT